MGSHSPKWKDLTCLGSHSASQKVQGEADRIAEEILNPVAANSDSTMQNRHAFMEQRTLPPGRRMCSGLALLPVQEPHVGISEAYVLATETRPMHLVTTTFAELTRNLVPRYVGVLAFCNMPTAVRLRL